MPTYPYTRGNPSGWSDGQKVTAAQINTIDQNAAAAADGTLWTDALIAKNWPHKTTVTGARVAVYARRTTTEAHYSWRVVGTSDAEAASFTGSEWSTPGTLAALPSAPRCFVANDLTVLIGGDPGGSSAQKIARSTTGLAGSFAAVNSIDSGTAVVDCLTHFNSLYIAGLSDGGIETSADGSTWADQTVPNSNARKEFATDGSILLCFSSATTDKYITSTDGAAWTERSLPASATGYRGCYCSQLEKFFAVQQQASPVLYESSDGISWSTVANDAGFSSTTVLVSYGRVLVAASGTAALVSTDGGATWTRGAHTFAGSGWNVSGSNTITYGGGRLVAIDADAVVWSSLRFT